MHYGREALREAAIVAQTKSKTPVVTDAEQIRAEIDRALREQRVVHLGYRSKERGNEVRQIRPMSVEKTKKSTLLVGFDTVRGTVRYLTVSRIVAVQLPKGS